MGRNPKFESVPQKDCDKTNCQQKKDNPADKIRDVPLSSQGQYPQLISRQWHV